MLCYRWLIALKDTIKAKAVMTDPVSGVKMIGMDIELVFDNCCRIHYLDVQDLYCLVSFPVPNPT